MNFFNLGWSFKAKEEGVEKTTENVRKSIEGVDEQLEKSTETLEANTSMWENFKDSLQGFQLIGIGEIISQLDSIDGALKGQERSGEDLGLMLDDMNYKLKALGATQRETVSGVNAITDAWHYAWSDLEATRDLFFELRAVMGGPEAEAALRDAIALQDVFGMDARAIGSFYAAEKAMILTREEMSEIANVAIQTMDKFQFRKDFVPTAFEVVKVLQKEGRILGITGDKAKGWAKGMIKVGGAIAKALGEPAEAGIEMIQSATEAVFNFRKDIDKYFLGVGDAFPTEAIEKFYLAFGEGGREFTQLVRTGDMEEISKFFFDWGEGLELTDKEFRRAVYALEEFSPELATMLERSKGVNKMMEGMGKVTGEAGNEIDKLSGIEWSSVKALKSFAEHQKQVMDMTHFMTFEFKGYAAGLSDVATMYGKATEEMVKFAAEHPKLAKLMNDVARIQEKGLKGFLIQIHPALGALDLFSADWLKLIGVFTVIKSMFPVLTGAFKSVGHALTPIAKGFGTVFSKIILPLEVIGGVIWSITGMWKKAREEFEKGATTLEVTMTLMRDLFGKIIQVVSFGLLKPQKIWDAIDNAFMWVAEKTRKAGWVGFLVRAIFPIPAMMRDISDIMSVWEKTLANLKKMFIRFVKDKVRMWKTGWKKITEFGKDALRAMTVGVLENLHDQLVTSVEDAFTKAFKIVEFGRNLARQIKDAVLTIPKVLYDAFADMFIKLKYILLTGMERALIGWKKIPVLKKYVPEWVGGLDLIQQAEESLRRMEKGEILRKRTGELLTEKEVGVLKVAVKKFEITGVEKILADLESDVILRGRAVDIDLKAPVREIDIPVKKRIEFDVPEFGVLEPVVKPVFGKALEREIEVTPVVKEISAPAREVIPAVPSLEFPDTSKQFSLLAKLLGEIKNEIKTRQLHLHIDGREFVRVFRIKEAAMLAGQPGEYTG